jgi:SNF2 family DNA or RNA helicase
LTGTVILNRADEFFVPLNLISPEKFHSQDSFRRNWLEKDQKKNQWSKVKPYLQNQFKNEIKDIYLRREKEDVYKDTPPLNTMFTVIEPDIRSYARLYNDVLDKMSLELAQSAKPPQFMQMAKYMSELRKICGLMKLSWTLDYLESWALDSSDKLAIGIHHIAVRDILYLKLGSEANCMKLSGEDSSDQKDYVMRQWANASQQFLIINTLAGGIGMDFHYCDSVLVLERQWNREMERQFEFRFYNPDPSIKSRPTNVEYVVAKGTFDGFLYDLIERKKANVDPLVYNNWDLESQPADFRTLIEETISHRL